LIIPSNKTPWIIRINYQEKKYLDILNSSFLKKLFSSAISIRSYFTSIFDKNTKNVSSDIKSLGKEKTYEITLSKSLDTSFRNRNDVNGFFPASTQKKKNDCRYTL
jgi:hypothetical protein